MQCGSHCNSPPQSSPASPVHARVRRIFRSDETKDIRLTPVFTNQRGRQAKSPACLDLGRDPKHRGR